MNIFQVDLNNTDDNCAICQLPLLHETNTPLHTLKECKHTYHTDCIIAWFRTRNNRCPLCGNSGINHYEETYCIILFTGSNSSFYKCC